MARERDVRNAIKELLVATGAFSDVWLTGLPQDRGQGAANSRLRDRAGLDATREQLGCGPLRRPGLPCELAVSLLTRRSDPQLRDELAEQLLDFLINAVNGQSLANFTIRSSP